ncbi:MAG: hypothetical protein MK101_04600 [Phycisphaerales bacterium]|nr:hypothetical protein [Phycisphaerales bacterium]
MTFQAVHGWQDGADGGFRWLHQDEGIPADVTTALERLSGHPWLSSPAPPSTFSISLVDAGGEPWHALTRVAPKGSLPDGRPLREAHHLVSPAIGGGALPGQQLHELGGAAYTAGHVDPPWDACGGDWSHSIAEQIAAGRPLQIVFPKGADALQWWMAIEARLGQQTWKRTVLLERLPGAAGADVVIAVDGSPCCAALRSAPRALLDLATTPRTPPTAASQDTPPIPYTPTLLSAGEDVQMPDVELRPGGPPVGLAALTVLALLLLVGAAVVIVWALDTGGAP